MSEAPDVKNSKKTTKHVPPEQHSGTKTHTNMKDMKNKFAQVKKDGANTVVTEKSGNDKDHKDPKEHHENKEHKDKETTVRTKLKENVTKPIKTEMTVRTPTAHEISAKGIDDKHAKKAESKTGGTTVGQISVDQWAKAAKKPIPEMQSTKKKTKESKEDVGGEKKASKDSRDQKDSVVRNQNATPGQEKSKKPQKRQLIFAKGAVVLNRYEIGDMFNCGGFGQVYHARDMVTKDAVAVKVDISPDIRRTKLEIQVLVQLRGQAHIPEIFAYGKVKEHAYFVIQLLGRNLLELRMARSTRKFTHGTLYRVAKQLFAALLSLHNEGWVHRDVKPANVCIGRLDMSRIYLLDFGMVRQYRDAHGQPRKPRAVTGFRGTQKYASITAHQKREQGPFSDLQSAIYTIVELGEGTLPWGNKKAVKETHILKLKKETSLRSLCGSQPAPFHKLAKYILSLAYEDIPDYDQINELCDKCIPTGIDKHSWYDWELKEVKERAAPRKDISIVQTSTEQEIKA